MSKSSKKTEEYWEDRIRAEIEARKASDRSLAQEMTNLYDYHFKAMETEIEAFVNRYAVKNNLTKQEALKRVDEFDVSAFATKAKKYVEEKDFSAQANAELSLYNLKMKVNRLELLEYQLDLEMLALAEEERQLTEKFLRDGYLSAAQLQAGLLGQSVGSLTSEREAILNAPFHGVRWSDNIWQRQTELRKIVARGVESTILRGHSPLDFVPKLRKEFEVSNYAARRLAITESARIQTEVQKLSLEKAGFTKYRISHEDKRWEANGSACDICKRFISDSYDVKDMKAGVTAPPFHPFCRCAAVPEVGEGDDVEKIDQENELLENWNMQYPHMSNITHELIDGQNHIPDIEISNQVTKDGVTYVVDGHNVVSDHSNNEHKVASWLSSKTGMQVDILPRVNIPENINTPDYLVAGVPFDLKAFSGSGKYVIDNNSRKAKTQAPNIIFDATKSPLSDEDLLKQLDDVYRSGRRGLGIAVLKRGSEIICIVQPR